MNIISHSLDEWVRLVSAGDGDKLELPLWLQVKGNSMYPFIRSDTDKVILMPAKPEELKIGDIVLFPWKGTAADYCLHRIYKIDGDRVQTFGDGNRHPDGWITKQEVLGKAVLIQRGKREISCDDPKWVRRFRIWCSLWRIRGLLLLPVRVLNKIKRVFNRIFCK